MTPKSNQCAALYARYSTDKQSEASVEDQFRVAEQIAARDGFTVVARFHDRAISGGTSKRPGYQAMLDAARQREFVAIIAEDSSRLWRNMAEQAPRLAELYDLGIQVVTHDLDTRSESSAVLGAVTGAMSEQYRKEIGRRTRRGLEGRALRKLPVGGRAYGYIAARDSATKQMEINAEQAAVVLRIFELYASGKTPRQIAQALNADHIPSPGAAYRRSDDGDNAKRRDGKWLASVIHGDVTRGTGILNNPRYVGRVIWGRTRWQRGAADSSIRLSRPATQPVIEHLDERMRIVPDELWKRVKGRQKSVRVASESVRNALSSRVGRPARNLLSGLLRCETCSSNFVRINQREYRCATHTNGGKSGCENGFKLHAMDAEQLLLQQIESELLSPQAVEAAIVAYKDEAKQLRRQRRTEQPRGAITAAVARKQKEIEQLRQMVRAGTIDATTLQPAIDAAERERERLVAQGQARDDSNVAAIVRMLPEAAGEYRGMVRQLRDARELLTDVEYAETRACVFEMLGGRVVVRPRADGSAVLTLNLDSSLIFKSYKSTRYNLVAGACYTMFRSPSESA